MDGVQLPQGWSHFEEAVYFLPLSSQKFLVLILSTSEEWKAESTLEPPTGFEHGGSLDWESSALTTRPLLHANSMKKTSSMSKDGSNFIKSCFGCYFRCSLVNFKNFIILFWSIWVIYGLWKSWGSSVFNLQHIKMICNSQSRIA